MINFCCKFTATERFYRSEDILSKLWTNCERVACFLSHCVQTPTVIKTSWYLASHSMRERHFVNLMWSYLERCCWRCHVCNRWQSWDVCTRHQLSSPLLPAVNEAGIKGNKLSVLGRKIAQHQQPDNNCIEDEIFFLSHFETPKKFSTSEILCEHSYAFISGASPCCLPYTRPGASWNQHRPTIYLGYIQLCSHLTKLEVYWDVNVKISLKVMLIVLTMWSQRDLSHHYHHYHVDQCNIVTSDINNLIAPLLWFLPRVRIHSWMHVTRDIDTAISSVRLFRTRRYIKKSRCSTKLVYLRNCATQR